MHWPRTIGTLDCCTSRTCFGGRETLAPSRRTRVGYPAAAYDPYRGAVRTTALILLVDALHPRAPGSADAVEVLARSFRDALTAGASAVVIRTFGAADAGEGRRLLRDLGNLVARESGERHRQERGLLRPRRGRDLPASKCRFAAWRATSPSFFPRLRSGLQRASTCAPQWTLRPPDDRRASSILLHSPRRRSQRQK